MPSEAVLSMENKPEAEAVGGDGSKDKTVESEGAGRSCLSHRPNLTDLSDELLLMVLRLLPPRDVRSLGLASSRFANVAADPSLWVSPDFSHVRGMTCRQFCERYMPFLGPWTTSLTTRGPLLFVGVARYLNDDSLDRMYPNLGDYVSGEFIRELDARCPNLKSLVLWDHHIDETQVRPGALPSSLEFLAFRRCWLSNPRLADTYFMGCHTTLSHLLELELHRCPWFSPSSLLSLSKCAHLKVLRITHCPGIHYSLRTTSLACMSGFEKLKVLDLRRTQVGDQELMFFSQLQQLEELLLEQRPPVVLYSSDASDSSDDTDTTRKLLPLMSPEMIFYSQVTWLEQLLMDQPADDDLDDDNDDVLPGQHLGLEFMQWFRTLMVSSVSDTGICLLGKGPHSPWGVAILRRMGCGQKEHNPRLRKLVARGFSDVTDVSVDYLVHVDTLRYLDLTGCGVTRHALESFANLRPDVKVVGL
ncbi:uncharacterized protein LOC126293642 isoform X1 [Schistocerca gregaria]|uniref:uncharacterized protein LOC126293642 isoform X1 n=2 Tax=Schistocerca gregaria TaxID=7010 RepID=UPI00211DD0CE|nr:uncharacterized protein LOC126293642 isoform X1 [Schistocerca gregaria]